jgi:isopenicillin-N N-acyltransferase-like protein
MTSTPPVNETGAIPRVRVEGTSYERGRQYGAQAKDRVRLSVQAYQRVFAHYAGWDWPQVRRAATAFEAPIADFRPGYLEEMRGIADGAGLDLADVLAINVRTEVMYAAEARHAPLASRAPHPPASQPSVPRPPAECSAFAVAPAPGQARLTLIGQNWDWLLHSAQTLVILEARQDDGPDFVTVVEAGLLAKTGLNSAGLGLVTNALVTETDTGTPGLPYHVLLRALLDCSAVTEALKVLQAGTRSSSANYLLAHQGGAALDIEAAPGDFTRLYPLLPDHGVLLHTNHFLSPGLHPVDLSLWSMPSSAVRLQRLRAGAPGPAEPGLDRFRALLADHADYPYSICAHPDPNLHPLEQGATIASVLMDLTARQMWVAPGPPCQAAYQELDLSWLGSRPARPHAQAGAPLG